MNIHNLFKGAPATCLIAAVCIGIYIVTALQAGLTGDLVWGSDLGIRMVVYGPFVVDQPLGWARLVTAGFLHLGLTHLFMNMLMLVVIGAEVEKLLGSWRFTVAWLFGVVGSSAAVLAMDFSTPTAGASGALYTVMVVLIAIALRRSADLRAPVALVVVNVAFTFLMPGVSLWGHLGGLAVGLVVAWPVTSRMKTQI